MSIEQEIHDRNMSKLTTTERATVAKIREQLLAARHADGICTAVYQGGGTRTYRAPEIRVTATPGPGEDSRRLDLTVIQEAYSQPLHELPPEDAWQSLEAFRTDRVVPKPSGPTRGVSAEDMEMLRDAAVEPKHMIFNRAALASGPTREEPPWKIRQLQPEMEVTWHRHPNGGGWVSDTATVEKTVFVGPHAAVYGCARVYDQVEVRGTSRVCGEAWVGDEAVVCGEAVVGDEALVRGKALVCGEAWVGGQAVVRDRATVGGKAEAIDVALVGDEVLSS